MALPQAQGRQTSADVPLTAVSDLPGFYCRVGKRALDIVGSVILLVIFAPLLLIVSVLLARRNGRPVLFRQERVGKGGSVFRVIKFRTMKPERRQSNVIHWDGPERRNGTHKTLADPRHTKTGQTLRRYSLDELPQLWNVLRGDMSLVGPRPELVTVAETTGIRNHCRHAVRPGITGPWQVSRDRDGFLSQNLHYDEAYTADISLRTDVGILFRTLGAVVRASGS